MLHRLKFRILTFTVTLRFVTSTRIPTKCIQVCSLMRSYCAHTQNREQNLGSEQKQAYI